MQEHRFSLTVFVFIAVINVVFGELQTAEKNLQFEAAFQGRCGIDSPCQQLCYELHDGMFECDCKVGFSLHEDGYTCTRNDSATDKIKEFEQDIGLTFVDSNDIDSEDSVRFVKISKPTSTTDKAHICSLQCGEGVCVFDNHGKSTCRCPFGKTGSDCQITNQIRYPRFNGLSWLAFPPLRGAYKHAQISLEFRPESWDGILFLAGERDDLVGDFMAILLHNGFLEFRFDCGSGIGVVKSDETVILNQWNTLSVYRHRWDAWIQLNRGKRIAGRSKGLFSRITFREPVFIGGPGNTSGLVERLPTDRGFVGCIRLLQTNDHRYDFGEAPAGDTISAKEIEECSTDKCTRSPCQHGGKCVTSNKTSLCLCPLGYTGDLCGTKLDLQVPAFNGSSYLRHPALGDTALSWLDLDITFKTQSPNGLILYEGYQKYGTADFISVYLINGYLEFAFDLGTGTAILRSPHIISLNEWHKVLISRTGRLATMFVDNQSHVQVLSPGAFTQLSLPLSMFIGGTPDFDEVSSNVKMRNSFRGCIQKIVVNDKPLRIVQGALSGANIGNCPHPCVAKPCGTEAQCIPVFDKYKCVCNKHCNSTDSSQVSFDGTSFVHYTNREIQKRITDGHLEIDLRFRTTALSGLILWTGRTDRSADYLALGLQDGRIEVAFDLGSGETVLKYNASGSSINDGRWHKIKFTRHERLSVIVIDNGTKMFTISNGKLNQLNTNTGLYFGGTEDVEKSTGKRYKKGFIGCVSDFVLNTDYQVKLSWSTNTKNVCIS
ncbi:pikachurin-like [Daktulosphaira vitifoliae]|uniref:pikachurin-like n=1 Tax=Daktulosphaira vitifoliae TaxID=58002 RepID=UPI0021AAA950|nr:pikachurin-like [Daktulosphaira vitifoliae]